MCIVPVAVLFFWGSERVASVLWKGLLKGRSIFPVLAFGLVAFLHSMLLKETYCFQT